MPMIKPWHVLWNPGGAMPELARRTPLGWMVVLGAVAGTADELATLLSKAVPRGKLQPLGETLLMYAVFGTAVQLFTIWGMPWLFSWAANKLGARSTAAELRAVLVWSLLPRGILLVFLLALFALRPEEFVLWGSAEFREQAHFLYGVYLALQGGTGLWSALLLVLGLAAVAGLSTGRAFGAFVMGALAWSFLGLLAFAALLWKSREHLPSATEFFTKW